MPNQACLKCGEEKPLDAFEKQKARPSHRKVCKVCRYSMRNRETERARHRAYQKERRATQPELVRRLWEKAVYGKCKEELGEQKCAICASTEKLHIDHNHETGVVRGLLCGTCNAGIGMFRDKIELLKNAIDYLGKDA
jgi:hypothetical protein